MAREDLIECMSRDVGRGSARPCSSLPTLPPQRKLPPFGRVRALRLQEELEEGNTILRQLLTAHVAKTVDFKDGPSWPSSR
jgi:hypothetical protein